MSENDYRKQFFMTKKEGKLQKSLLSEEQRLRKKQPQSWHRQKYRFYALFEEEKLKLYKKEGVKKKPLTRGEVNILRDKTKERILRGD